MGDIVPRKENMGENAMDVNPPPNTAAPVRLEDGRFRPGGVTFIGTEVIRPFLFPYFFWVNDYLVSCWVRQGLFFYLAHALEAGMYLY